MPAQWYVHDILQPHVLRLKSQEPNNARSLMARVSQDCLRTVTTLPWPGRSPDLSPIEHIWDHLGRACMPQFPIVSHRALALERAQQDIKSSVLLPFSLE
ncbi:transposable element Tcb2 transposase [Trichonephila clavipes]|nr:transposable element Tcb2 transposase [Trichonephila clavipes]